MQFNKEQEQAILHRDGPMMVLAGPGSGKTTVLVQRILHLTKTLRIDPSSLLVITFTRAAAKEMEERYKKKANGGGAVTFGTFHSVFFRILCEARGFSASNIASGRQCFDILSGILKSRFASCRFTTDMTELLLGAIGACKSNEIPWGEAEDCPVEKNLFCEIAEAYAKEMRRQGLIDFDDMLTECLNLLKEDRSVLMKLRRRYAYVMVDEFQDINQTQYEIVKRISAPRNHLFIVGDDDQSIYGFRGSKPELMLAFPNEFPGCKTVLLGTNYRSKGRIVRHSLSLIAHNQVRYEKALRAHAQEGAPDTVEVHAAENAQDEAERVAALLKKRMDGGGSLSDAAVLFRTRGCASALPKVLDAVGIPYTVGAKTEKKGVRLMTFHASKGLEFDEVLLIGANEGEAPSRKAANDAQIEEERRMFYVAMTRAKHKLHIFVTDDPYNTNKKKSRFVTEAGCEIQKEKRLLGRFTPQAGSPHKMALLHCSAANAKRQM